MGLPKWSDKDDAPGGEDDIRQAVRQLSFAYKRAAQTVEAAALEGAPKPVKNVGTEQASIFDSEDEKATEALRRAEALLFASGQPLSADQVAAALPPGVEAADVLMRLARTYRGRGVVLAEVGGKWRFQTATDLAFLFVEERRETKKLSQAALETLAIIAYGQPVTRAEIEAVRGVAVSKGIIDQLMEAGWVKPKGRRRTPGRPVTLGTTAAFLEHFGLESLELLPGRAELEADGLLSASMPIDMSELSARQPSESDAFDQLPDGDLEQDFMQDFLGAPESGDLSE
ncbi:MAG: SMC-Scp complex subunit ScpB [Pseudomonadota bacterium]